MASNGSQIIKKTGSIVDFYNQVFLPQIQLRLVQLQGELLATGDGTQIPTIPFPGFPTAPVGPSTGDEDGDKEGSSVAEAAPAAQISALDVVAQLALAGAMMGGSVNGGSSLSKKRRTDVSSRTKALTAWMRAASDAAGDAVQLDAAKTKYGGDIQ